MQGSKFALTITPTKLERSVCMIISQKAKTLKSTIIQPRKQESIELTLQLFCPDIFIDLPSGQYPLSLYSFFSSSKQPLHCPEGIFELTLLPNCESLLYFSIKGFNLDDLDITSLSDPYFVMSSQKVEVYKSEVIVDNLNPVWKSFTVKENLIRDSVVFNVWDQDPGTDDFIGVCEVRKEELMAGLVEIDIRNEKKKGNSKSGRLRIVVKRVKSLSERLFEGFLLRTTFLVPCFFEYGNVVRMLEVLMSCFQFGESQFFGFGSSESYGWKIGGNLRITEVVEDGIMSRKNVGPSIAGPVLSSVLKEADRVTANLVFVIVIRDFFDPKTIGWITDRAKKENCFVYFLVRTGISCPNLESCSEAILLRYTEVEEDLLKQYGKIVDDLENNLC